MVKRLAVGAHYGFRDWLAQRVTAVVMALYTVFFLIRVALLPAHDNAAWRGMFTGGFTKFATFLFFMALFFHAWVGVRDIWMDYVKPISVRLALHVATLFVLVGYAGWVAQILWRL
ncbi:succinate dehydrogenase, hydrophobic membrane anchor protein [Uliginosibacterium paludis]|uniref:Succinate dehydrogenase hydrophobic membrane anchor subunit n=1 Tax=Uliginosibacterium paludis TaxID=1615952 RepID=A0ABV2CV19_9RHOO